MTVRPTPVRRLLVTVGRTPVRRLSARVRPTPVQRVRQTCMMFSASATTTPTPARFRAVVEAFRDCMISLSSSLFRMVSSCASTMLIPFRSLSSRCCTRRLSITLARAPAGSFWRRFCTASPARRLADSASAASRLSMLRRHCSSPSCAPCTSSSGTSPTIFWRARMYAPASTSSRQFIPCVGWGVGRSYTRRTWRRAARSVGCALSSVARLGRGGFGCALQYLMHMGDEGARGDGWQRF